jgi:hypothetical protein
LAPAPASILVASFRAFVSPLRDCFAIAVIDKDLAVVADDGGGNGPPRKTRQGPRTLRACQTDGLGFLAA